jgi:hypothetical protein
MSHPTDGEAWQAMDHFDPEFARDPRSVHLGLWMDDLRKQILMFSFRISPQKFSQQIFLYLYNVLLVS